jgi:hypothetical protein
VAATTVRISCLSRPVSPSWLSAHSHRSDSYGGRAGKEYLDRVCRYTLHIGQPSTLLISAVPPFCLAPDPFVESKPQPPDHPCGSELFSWLQVSKSCLCGLRTPILTTSGTCGKVRIMFGFFTCFPVIA